MRLAILADIHGNLPAVEAVVADAQQQAAEHFIVAGDLLGGPQPVEVVSLLRGLSASVIRGNNEEYALRLIAGDAPEVWRVRKQFAFVRYTSALVDEATYNYLATLPEQRVVTLPGTDPIRVVHGSPRSAVELIYPDVNPAQLAEVLMLVAEPVMVCGHTHLAWIRQVDGKLAVNPGSAGASINGDPRAHYALLTWQRRQWEAELRAVAYDVERACAVFESSGLLIHGGPLARAAMITIRTGRDVFLMFLSHAMHLTREAGYSPDVIPDLIWDRAVVTFDWEAAARA